MNRDLTLSSQESRWIYPRKTITTVYKENKVDIYGLVYLQDVWVYASNIVHELGVCGYAHLNDLHCKHRNTGERRQKKEVEQSLWKMNSPITYILQ